MYSSNLNLLLNWFGLTNLEHTQVKKSVRLSIDSMHRGGAADALLTVLFLSAPPYYVVGADIAITLSQCVCVYTVLLKYDKTKLLIGVI